MISFHIDLHCDAPNCHERISLTDLDTADPIRLEEIARHKGWGIRSPSNVAEDHFSLADLLLGLGQEDHPVLCYRHLCPECARNPKRHL